MKIKDKDKIIAQINETDQELCSIQKLIANYKNISDARTKEFLTVLNKKIQDLRLNNGTKNH